jgi:hypothetical protein|tara:strand:- start:1485 stop:2666 length:1182 start_codon:yes stop_codon:yes gene_type:complete
MGSILNFIFPLPSEHTQTGPISNYIKSKGYQYTTDLKILDGYKNVLLIETFHGTTSFQKMLTDEFVSYVLKNNLIICVCSVIDPDMDEVEGDSLKITKTLTRVKKIYDNVVYIHSNTNLENDENVYTLHYFFEETVRDKLTHFGTDNDLGYVSIKIKEEELDSYRNKKFLSFSRNNDKTHRKSLLHDYLTNDFSDSYFSFLQKINSANNCNIYNDTIAKLSSSEYNEKLPIELDTHGYGHIIDSFKVSNTFPTKLFLDSAIHIVSETSFESNEMFISEKIFKPILNFQPFILIGPYRYLKELHKLGFKTFGEFWDESYDEIKDPKNRYLKLIEVILDLNKKSIEEINLLYKNVKHICIYNNKLFQEMESPDGLKKIFNVIENENKRNNISNRM